MVIANLPRVLLGSGCMTYIILNYASTIICFYCIYNCKYYVHVTDRSTETAFSFLTNTWLKIKDNGLYTMIDSSKCFESVHRGILLQKLVKYGITHTEYSWFKSYLDNRQQVINFNDQISDKENLNNGVPQGTVLGPILFLIYIKELSNILPYNSCVMFANDITIFSAAKNLNDAAVTLQNFT